MDPLSKDACKRLIDGAERADRLTEWPEASWQALRDAGVLRWSIPSSHGGDEWSLPRLLTGSEAISQCCMTTAFVLSQREAALRRILKGPEALQERYLRPSAAGEALLTVGLSQLTTSRQHGGPALLAIPTASGFRVNGEIPWVTAAAQATAIVAGASLEGDRQVLFVLPTDRAGVQIDPPLTLSALCGSLTSLVQCRNVEIEAADLLAAPAERILGPAGGGGLETSCLAIGLAGAALGHLQAEAGARPEVGLTVRQLGPELAILRHRLHAAVAMAAEPNDVLKIRADCTAFALKATQLTLLLIKGKGFVAPHPAQRWARQALFFLVWSCPRSVSEALLSHFIAEFDAGSSKGSRA